MSSCAAAFVTFCAVQDHLVRDGAAQYVIAHRAAIALHQPPIPIDDAMGPAIERSVRLGLVAGGGVLVAGIGLTFLIARPR